MKKIFLFLALSFSLSLSASHTLGMYFEHYIDSANQEMTVELHIVLDSAGISFTQTSINLNGPLNVSLQRQGPPTPYTPWGTPACVEGRYYEIVFANTFDYSSLLQNSSPSFNFSVSLPCCVAPLENYDGGNNNFIEFVLKPLISPFGGMKYLPNFDNRGLNPAMVQNAYPGFRNYLDFGFTAPARGADQVISYLDEGREAPNQLAIYPSGYSGFFPLPDVTEDSLNGPIIFDTIQRVISARARAGSYTPGMYFLQFQNDYYRQGSVFLSDETNAFVFFRGQRTPVPDTLTTVIVGGGQNPVLIQDSLVELSYPYRAGQNLSIDLLSFAAPGEQIYTIEARLIEDSSQYNIPPNSNFAWPQFKNRNAGNLPYGLDTGRLEVNFLAQSDNFLIGPQEINVQLSFTNGTCGGKVNVVRLKFIPDPQPIILVDNVMRDSLELCEGLSAQIQAVNSSNGDYWSPGSWTQDSTLSITTLTNNYQSGNLYRRNAQGQKVDSLTLSVYRVDTIYPLQLGLQEDIYMFDGRNSSNQRWLINGLVEVPKYNEDLLPILGAGSYQLESAFGPYECLHQSDTLRIAEDYLWGASFGEDQAYVDQVKTERLDTQARYVARLLMPNDARFFSRIFFYGFRNPNPAEPKTVTMSVATTYGYSKSVSFTITNENHLEFPVDFDLAIGLFAELEVTLPKGLEYQYLDYGQAGFTRNALRMSDFRLALGNNPNLSTTSRRLPFGFRYKGSIGLSESEVPNLKIYPNPSHGQLTVEWDGVVERTLELYALSGRLVKKLKLKAGSQVLNLNLRPGVYLVKGEGINTPLKLQIL